MIETKRQGGLTEYIPTLSEKRDSLIRDNVFSLLLDLDQRLRNVETLSGISPTASKHFKQAISRIKHEESANHELNNRLLEKPAKF